MESIRTNATGLVQAISDYVHSHIRFDYLKARANRTALEAFRELSRFHALGYHLLPELQHSCPLLHRLPGGHRRIPRR